MPLLETAMRLHFRSVFPRKLVLTGLRDTLSRRILRVERQNHKKPSACESFYDETTASLKTLWPENTLQRRAPYMAHKGRCNTFDLLHNFLLKSIPI
jgi:hypothetical protein